MQCTKLGIMKGTPLERFEARVRRGRGCWLWTGARSGGRYGKLNIKGQSIATHRFSWEVHNGPIPEGMQVLHRCDIPHCVNPAHLFLGTHMDNMRDRDEKGRQAKPKGELHGRAVLTETDVRAIRREYAAGRKQGDLAYVYGVCQSMISRIVNRKLWGHVRG